LFNVRQSLSENRLPLSQVRDAAVQSQFATAAELQEWLARALEGNHEILYRAWAHARQAATLAPLDGDAWLRLGELCFLEGRGFAETDAYLQQATIVRPFDGRLLFEVGRQWGGRGLDEWVVALWARAARLPGPHRVHIARSVAGRMPVAAIVEAFAPEWDALPEYWRVVGNPEAGQPAEEIAALLTYAGGQADRESATARPEKAAFMWRTLGQMQRDAAQTDAAIASFARACAALPDDYASHKLLGLTLCETAQHDDAETQLAWCRNRRTDDPAVEAAVVRIAQAREQMGGSVLR
jgi:tetratricopeptide (TPR) repeat protein